jgi:D-alanyl-D-alanine dipeptidase
MHNFGMALDLSLIDHEDQEIITGSHFDDFRDLAQPKHEAQLLTENVLTPQAVANRRLLRSLMERAGFIQLPHEWWHYNALPKTDVMGRFALVE